MSELLEEWVKYHSGGQYRRYDYHLHDYQQAIALADEMVRTNQITIELEELVSSGEHILLEIRTLDLPKVGFLFKVKSTKDGAVLLEWLPRRQTDKPIMLAYRAGARAAIRHGLASQDISGPSPDWVAEVMFRHARRTRSNPFEQLDLHWTAVGSEPQEAFEKLYPRFTSGPDFEAADQVLRANALAIAKKLEAARDSLDTVEKRARERKLWGDLHQIGSATIVLSQKLAAKRREGDEEAAEKIQAAVAELELSSGKADES